MGTNSLILIEADFDELFREQLEKILTSFDKLNENPNALLKSLRMNYFLKSVQSFRKADVRIDKTIKSIFKANELYLSIQFFDFKIMDYLNNKITVLERFEIYLQMVCECRYADYSRVVLDDYAEIYRKGWIMSSYKVGHYLKKIDTEGKYKDVIESNKRFSDFNDVKIHTLRNRIDLAYLSGKAEVLGKIITVRNEKNLEKEILEHIPNNAFAAGYEQGISRLLIYLTNKNTILL